jgi:hypothetical protein
MVVSTLSGTVDGVVALEPRKLVEAIERGPTIPLGSEERFSGYGVVGLAVFSQEG